MIYLFLYGSLPVCGVIFHDRHDVRRFFYTIWLFFFLYLLDSDLKLVVIGTDIIISSKSCDIRMSSDAAQLREPLFHLQIPCCIISTLNILT